MRRRSVSLVALQVLTLLLEAPTDDSVEIAVGFVTECGDWTPCYRHHYADPMVRPNSTTDHLPQAHTCFNMLCIPVYETEEQVAAALRHAIDAGAGFGFR